MSDQGDDDNNNDEVKTIEPTIGTYIQKTDDELIITAGGKEYDHLIKDQWNLDDIGNKEEEGT